MTHRERIDTLVEAYLRTDPDRAAPTAATEFARFAAVHAARGARVRLVHGEDGTDPARPRHTWVRVLNVEGIHGYDVDVIGGAGDGAVLVWPMDGAHPEAGVFRTLRVEGAVPPG